MACSQPSKAAFSVALPSFTCTLTIICCLFKELPGDCANENWISMEAVCLVCLGRHFSAQKISGIY